MIAQLRGLAGWGALGAYLVMSGILYIGVLPRVNWHFPPDFHLLGYDAERIAPFLEALRGDARAGYLRVLTVWDRVFIVALALWMALTGWRGSGLRYVVAALAVLYAAIDLAENAALLDLLRSDVRLAGQVELAHHLTMAKFASLYLCGLVLLVHVRRTG